MGCWLPLCYSYPLDHLDELAATLTSGQLHRDGAGTGMSDDTSTSLRFTTKAGTLEMLQGHLRSARLLPQCRLTVVSWRKNRRACLRRIVQHAWPEMAVRSSSAAEDGYNQSSAGKFDSRLRVSPRGLEQAIQAVVESMERRGPNERDEVFVQPMLTDVAIAGVALGLDPSSGAPYYVVNYDDHS